MIWYHIHYKFSPNHFPSYTDSISLLQGQGHKGDRVTEVKLTWPHFHNFTNADSF